MKYVRWLGAYGSGPSLRDCLLWERRPPREVACEAIPKGRRSGIEWAHVGLILDPKCIRRTFSSDVYSRSMGEHLVPTHGSHSPHREAFASHPVILAVVVKGNVAKKVMRTCRWFAKTVGVPVVRVKRKEVWR